jgi:UDP-N-acetylmuramate dehydrogenase
MEEQLAKRDASQPTKDRTAGSTFRNPAGYSSTGRADDTHEMKAWKLMTTPDCGARWRGGALMNPDCTRNFLTNAGAPRRRARRTRRGGCERPFTITPG